MHWNYRIAKRLHGNDVYYTIVEAYYENDEVDMYSDDSTPLGIYGEDPEEVVRVLEMMLADAVKGPVLDLDEFDAQHPRDIEESEEDGD